MDEFWQRAAVAGGVVLAALVIARLVDRMLARRLEVRPEMRTRYRVVRRSAVATIVAVGILSALIVIPPVRAVAGTVLASSAVIALVLGFAAQTTLSNFVAGLLIALTQPLRLGDHVEVGAAAGVVEEIALTYTTIRSPDGARFYVPNTRLASDTIRNATLSGMEHLARVTVAVPLAADLDRVRELLVEEARSAPDVMTRKEPVATVTRLDAASAELAVDTWAETAPAAVRAAAAVREAVHRRLRVEGVFA